MTLFITLFIAGLLTILLPCILPLIPIVLGVSIAGRSKWRPLLTIAGMLVSFIGFTFLLLVVLDQFVELADYIRLATYYILLLFGLGFLTHYRPVQFAGALLGSAFFLSKGWIAVLIGAAVGILALELGGRVATRIQQFGADVQKKTREEFGQDSPFTAFIIGLTLGLVWVPCAGPALGFAFTLVRDEPGLRALLALASYGLGTAVPLLLIGYGGQAAVHSVRAMSRYTGVIKQVSGVLLILTAIALQFRFFEKAQIWLLDHTNFGDLGTRIEEKLFERDMFETMENPEEEEPMAPATVPTSASSSRAMVKESPKSGNATSSERSVTVSSLPKIARAPEFTGLGPWHNSEPFTLASLKGKVVLVDFWTYSCINCIRTLPYLQGYWEKYQDKPFVLIGVHAPEFVFEKSETNVRDAIKRHGLTYPTAQDNDFGTWKAFQNRYWPAKYLIDADGFIRYTHFGEGAYEETDEAIASLLNEIGADSPDTPLQADESETGERRPLTHETYLGERSWQSLGNAQGGPSDKMISYVAPATLSLHKYYLTGQWQHQDGERQVLQGEEGVIAIRALAGEVNLVLGLEEGVTSVEADVWIDGKKTQSFTIDRHDLFNLYDGAYGEHEIVLKIHGKGVAGYAYTFGS